jgi:hypothetical protein
MNEKTICRTGTSLAKLVLPQPSWVVSNLVLSPTGHHIGFFLLFSFAARISYLPYIVRLPVDLVTGPLSKRYQHHEPSD